MQVTCSFLLSSSMRALSLSASFNISLFLQTMRSSILFPAENSFRRIFRFWKKVVLLEVLIIFCSFVKSFWATPVWFHRCCTKNLHLSNVCTNCQNFCKQWSCHCLYIFTIIYLCIFVGQVFSSLWNFHRSERSQLGRVSVCFQNVFFFFIVFVFLNPFVNVIILLVGLCFLIPLIKCLNHHWDCSRAVFPIFH